MNAKSSPLAEIAKAVAALLLPERCRVCRAPSVAALCPDCLTSVVYSDDDGSRDDDDGFQRAVCQYGQPTAGLIHRLKYAADRAALPAIAAIVAGRDLSPCDGADLIIPVPLHSARLRRRGLNQSLILALLFFPERRRDIRCDLLIRHRPTRPQTGLGGHERRRNLADAFSLTEKARALIAHKHLLLIDDVRTTGSTLGECRRVLLAGGAARVSCLTFLSADSRADAPTGEKKA
ncbi:MAG: hypothetical protein LBU39_03150 [Desulfobulbaceae bacterium]|jgi:ComF family protein|nr:hypothetical protein [Desulfobulbaceae bacterium]